MRQKKSGKKLENCDTMPGMRIGQFIRELTATVIGPSERRFLRDLGTQLEMDKELSLIKPSQVPADRSSRPDALWRAQTKNMEVSTRKSN